MNRKNRPPSILTTGPSPTTAYGLARHPSTSRSSRQYRPNDSSSDDDRGTSPRMPRSALANYFNLDFSFLDEDPPARSSTFSGARRVGESAVRKERPTSAASARAPADPRGRDEDYFSLNAMVGALPDGGNRDSISSTHSLPFPIKPNNLPFPSRPGNPRRVSSDSIASRTSGVYSPGEGPRAYIPSHLSPSCNGPRRPSTASFLSAESTGSSALSATYPQRPSPPLAFRADVETSPDTEEKRKRLAAFLDETASAMEGGKSLAMVLPEAQSAVRAHKSLAELATERAAAVDAQSVPRATRSGPVEYRHPFGKATSSLQEGDCRGSSTFDAHGAFVPTNYSDPPSPTSVEPPCPPAGWLRAEEDTREPDLAPNPGERSAGPRAGGGGSEDGGLTLGDMLSERPPFGLGRRRSIETNAKNPPARSLSERSPSTIRADSPTPAVPQPSPAEASEQQRAKKLNKRMRVIRELVETETSYAVDMAVVRDIYLARARGAHMAQIADHVMSTGLGLERACAPSSASPAIGSSSICEGRRTFAVSSHERRISAPSLSLSSRSSERRPSVVPSLPALMPGQPLMSEADLHVVFANLEEIAALAEGFANLLDSASGSEDPKVMDDRIGEVFVEMIPRIQQVYSSYCVRHHRAILRLQELEPTLRTYFSECKTLSHGRTNAWDLASLLIKPVQRCLKYPLLLDQILAVTPEDHPDRPLLQRANADMLMVAEHINEHKKRNEVVARIVNKDKHSQRRDQSRGSISSMGTTVTKKLLRSSQKAKTALGFAENGGDEMFDTLVALVDSTRSGVLRFSNEMRDWTKSTKAALEAQVAMVEGWIDMYAPMAGEHTAASMSYQRLCIFLDEVLIPIIESPWRELDYEVRRSLILKTDHLLSLFESPRQVIAKRNDKMLDHHRYLAKKLPADRRGSEDFLVLSSQLLEELPRFLGSVSRYFNIIVGHFAGAQAAYHEAVQERWNAFAQQWLDEVGDGYDDIQATFAAQHHPLAQLMDTLAAGLGLAASQSSSPSAISRKRASRLSHQSTASGMSGPAASRPSMSHCPPVDRHRQQNRQSSVSTTSDYSSDRRGNRGSLSSTTNRSSITSDSSALSLGRGSADSSASAGPVTPPPVVPSFGPQKAQTQQVPVRRRSMVVVHEPLGGYDRRSMVMRYDAPLPPPPVKEQQYHSDGSERSSSSAPGEPTVTLYGALDAPRPRESPGRANHALRDAQYLSAYSVYVPSSEEGDEFGEGPLYTAEAMTTSEANGAYRSGYAILSFREQDRLEVELEEADSAEGGCGWLLGRLVGGDGALGWVRTEDFVMLDEEETRGQPGGGAQ
ncbi:hypothetical protein JCM10213v2_000703 [Rhodosporidiobolus nylandii]